MNAKGEETDVDACVGDNVLVVAHKNDVDLEGACECSIACSTCHVILDDEVFDELPEPSEEEEDMLDLAYGLTPTYVRLFFFLRDVYSRTLNFSPRDKYRSRLGCQVVIEKDHENMRVRCFFILRKYTRFALLTKPHQPNRSSFRLRPEISTLTAMSLNLTDSAVLLAIELIYVY